MLKLKLLLASFALFVLAAMMPLGLMGSACYSASAATAPSAHHAMASPHPASDSACEMLLANDCCTNCCVVAPAPRAGVSAPIYAAYRLHVAPTPAHPGWSTAPPQRPPRA
ncbi:MAG: hypothetical protein C0476_10525 [Sphingomonas sp.]|nr:hypothetical protein [Sphingomonas sp.]